MIGKRLALNSVSVFELDAVTPTDSLRQSSHQYGWCLQDLVICLDVPMTQVNRNGKIFGHISSLFTIFNKYEPVNNAIKLRLWLNLYKYGKARTFSA